MIFFIADSSKQQQKQRNNQIMPQSKKSLSLCLLKSAAKKEWKPLNTKETTFSL